MDFSRSAKVNFDQLARVDFDSTNRVELWLGSQERTVARVPVTRHGHLLKLTSAGTPGRPLQQALRWLPHKTIHNLCLNLEHTSIKYNSANYCLKQTYKQRYSHEKYPKRNVPPNIVTAKLSQLPSSFYPHLSYGYHLTDRINSPDLSTP